MVILPEPNLQRCSGEFPSRQRSLPENRVGEIFMQANVDDCPELKPTTTALEAQTSRLDMSGVADTKWYDPML